MFLKTIQASAIKSVFEVLKDILNDVNVYFSPEGMRILTLDTAHVALVDLHLPAERFQEYQCPSNVVCGLNVSDMFKLLKIITSDDIISLAINSHDYMDILIENSKKGRRTEFQLKLLDINEEEIELPDVPFQVCTTLPSVDFQRLCRDMGNLGTDVTLTRDHQQFIFLCQGDTANQKTSIECVEEFDGVISGMYSLKYLNLFTKSTSMSSNIQILQESQNRFLILKYGVADLGDLRFFLATKGDE